MKAVAEIVAIEPEPTRDTPKKRQEADELIKLVEQTCELWVSTDGETYASHNGKHRRLRSEEFSSWLHGEVWKRTGRAASKSAIAVARATLEGLAQDGPKHPTGLRVINAGDTVWIDLADDAGHVVRVTAAGWEVVVSPPVRFERAKAMMPLPMPERGGTLCDLQRHLHLDETTWPLIAGWLVGACSAGPYPVLILRGPQGSGKSATARVLRSLIDPSIAPIASSPSNEQDLAAHARHSHVVAFDNLSRVTPAISDCLCRLSTGGGVRYRKLYTDNDEVVLQLKRPTLLTGITTVVTAPDLLDRALLVEMPPLADADRREERMLDAAWTAAHPKLFGALLDAVQAAIAGRDHVKRTELPRLADWLVFATAAEASIGLAAGTIADALMRTREDAAEIALDDSPIAKPLRALAMAECDRTWCGSAGELLEALAKEVGQTRAAGIAGWPRSATDLGKQLSSISPSLRQIGIFVEQLRRGQYERGKRAWQIAIKEKP